MRIVLFGKNGQVGWELHRLLPKLGDVIALGREDADISNIQAVQKTLNEIKPDLVINASAYTDVDRAEKEPELAMKVNAQAPAAMAETARKLGAVFIHYSTDYVFDGRHDTPYTEDEPANPLNVYGKSKLMGEKNIDQAGGAYFILRTSWVYSMRGNTFVNKVLGWARTNKTLKIVNDQISNPTWARALAEATVLLISKNKDNLYDVIHAGHGIYHLAGSGYTSRFEWAKQILASASDRTDLLVQSIEPVSSDEFPLPAARPLFSALDCSKFTRTFDIRLPDWEESLWAAMAE
jgi:dTDP-4-dehydrorhamnose reductase